MRCSRLAGRGFARQVELLGMLFVVPRVTRGPPLGPNGDFRRPGWLWASRGPCQLHWGPVERGIVVRHKHRWLHIKIMSAATFHFLDPFNQIHGAELDSLPGRFVLDRWHPTVQAYEPPNPPIIITPEFLSERRSHTGRRRAPFQCPGDEAWSKGYILSFQRTDGR
jgi:hypothetical protein